jgi:hypothetical protein
MAAETASPTQAVVVDGKAAMWLFTQFGVDCDPIDLFGCLNPIKWQLDDPAVFRTVQQVSGDSTGWPPGGDSPWQRTYREVVLFGGDLLDNELSFEFFQASDGSYVASTFDLAPGAASSVEVDRGFCLATRRSGGGSWIKALKILRLASDPVDQLATALTQEFSEAWGELVQAIVQAEAPGPKTIEPMPLGQTTAISAAIDPSLIVRVLASTYSTAAAEMGKTAVDWVSTTVLNFWSNVLARTYGWSDAAQDTLQISWKIVAESARVTQDVLGFVNNFAPSPGLVPRLSALTPIIQTEESVWRVGTSPAGQTLSSSGLTSLSSDGDVTVIGPDKIVLAATTTSDDQPAVHVVVNTKNAPVGLYGGDIFIGSQRIPLQFYVSQAMPTSSPSAVSE